MRKQVLKALANPAHIFYVPYSLAIINFVLQFLIFISIFAVSLLVSDGDVAINPLVFLISVGIVHFILAGFSKKEPQLAQIIAAKIHLYKSKIPRRLVT
ncbi:MAG: VirB3 family type IV secretion system protein [Rickettsiales bacterium]|jgi:type IV secretory pathway VirB3-like protein|nr:VirB3 family type IV secretion system protein [Rickettsiales bacterium]